MSENCSPFGENEPHPGFDCGGTCGVHGGDLVVRTQPAEDERVKEARARDAAQEIVIESSKAAGYADSTWLDGNFKHELINRITAALCLLPVQPAPIDFSCGVCSVQCVIAPDPPARAVCPEHCEDHDYEHDKSRAGSFCIHCDEQRPEDWDDD